MTPHHSGALSDLYDKWPAVMTMTKEKNKLLWSVLV